MGLAGCVVDGSCCSRRFLLVTLTEFSFRTLGSVWGATWGNDDVSVAGWIRRGGSMMDGRIEG